jgi:hypothetical protein
LSLLKARALLAGVSLLVGLALCEGALRLLDRGDGSAAPAVATLTAKLSDRERAAAYIDGLPAASGTDRRWFAEDPPPLPNRTPIARERQERYRDFERRGLYGPQADYIWNRRFVESQRCAPGSVFRNYPDKVLVFEPVFPSERPRFRFPPKTTTSSGLVTNDFGLRGRPLSLAKPPGIVRIAFLGASTTVCAHHRLFSYPDRVVDWLNRFAASNGYAARFEALNSGREGLNSEDFVRIFLDELVPLDPDLAVYYEGSNQFTSATSLAFPSVPARARIDPADPIAAHRLPAVLRDNLALGRLAERALNGFVSVGEPRKPAYVLRPRVSVDDPSPDPDDPGLPLQLPVIVKDLDGILAGMRSAGGRLALSSFVWLASEDLRLSPVRNRGIYEQLNTVLWPLRYADIRRLADFQNRVFRAYASERGADFLDVAADVPRDPELFSDAIHMTEGGDRLRAWIVFQRLVPIVRRMLDSGEWPRASQAGKLPPPPSLATFEMAMRCDEAPTTKLERVPGGLRLDQARTAFEQASMRRGPPMEITTAPQRWSYAVEIPIHPPADRARVRFVLVRGRVLEGAAGVGVLNDDGEALQHERSVPPSDAAIDIYLPVPAPERAAKLIIRNTAEGDVRTKMIVEDVALLAAGSQ